MKDNPILTKYLKHVDKRHFGAYSEECNTCRHLVRDLRYASCSSEEIKKLDNLPKNVKSFKEEPTHDNLKKRKLIATSLLYYHDGHITNTEVSLRSKLPIINVFNIRNELMFKGAIKIDINNYYKLTKEQLEYAFMLKLKGYNHEKIKYFSNLSDAELKVFNKNDYDVDKTLPKIRLYLTNDDHKFKFKTLVILHQLLKLYPNGVYLKLNNINDNKLYNVHTLLIHNLITNYVDYKNLINYSLVNNDATAHLKFGILMCRYTDICHEMNTCHFSALLIRKYKQYKKELSQMSMKQLLSSIYDEAYDIWISHKRNSYNYIIKQYQTKLQLNDLIKKIEEKGCSLETDHQKLIININNLE